MVVPKFSEEFLNRIKSFSKINPKTWLSKILISLVILTIGTSVILGVNFYNQKNQNADLTKKFIITQKALNDLKNVDQYKRNNELQATISAIQKTFSQAVNEYQNLLDLKQNLKDTSSYDTLFAQILQELSSKNYSSASSYLITLSNNISAEKQKLAAASSSSGGPATSSNTAPSNGFSRQSVTTDVGTFTVDIIAGDLNSTRVIVDTASDGDCPNNCPVLPLSDYVSRSGAYAGINGTFFCPAEYPSCAGKTGSFDTLLMNKNKVYFNSANNVYSTVPAVIFSGNSSRWVTQSLQWGRDTSVDSVIAMQPLLVLNGNIVFSGSDDPKFGSLGPRGFIATKGSTVFIGDVFGATMSDSAHVMKALGMDNALNLDEGGSTALIFNGSYLAGPGRNIPNAVLFVRK